MEFGMRGHDLRSDNIETLAQQCDLQNVRSLQLALAKSIQNFGPGLFTPSYARRMKAQLEQKGISVPVLGCYINPSETDPVQLEKNLSYFKENLKYARFLGADLVGLETCHYSKTGNVAENNTEIAYQHLLKNLRELVAEAEKLGVMIGIEAVHNYVVGTPQKMRRLLDDLASPNVCVILDPVNLFSFQNYQDQDAIMDEAFRLLHNEIAVLHFKDFQLTSSSLYHTAPLEGHLHRDVLYRLIHKYKPHLPVIFEYAKAENFETIVQTIQKEYQLAIQ